MKLEIFSYLIFHLDCKCRKEIGTEKSSIYVDLLFRINKHYSNTELTYAELVQCLLMFCKEFCTTEYENSLSNRTEFRKIILSFL